jgi:outer membrane protein OmpA-like peptidoglycan-associated protein/tetratricopeptide (TPR) repeat protein
MTVTRLLIPFFSLLSLTLLRGQNIDRANDLYKNGGFAQAIPIYEALLLKKPNSLALKTKLANCHRILSHPLQASRLFSEIVEAKDAKPIDFMHYGETLMMLEKYDSAKILFKKFNDLMPDDERGLLLLRNVDKVKTLRPLFEGVTVLPFLYNSDADDNAPAWSSRGIVFASDRPIGFKLLKEKNPATGRDYTNIYLAERLDDSTFNAPKEFSSKLSELNRNTSNATFTADGQRVYFCQNGNTPSKSGAYNMQVFTAERAENGWKSVELMPFCTPDNNYMYPSVSPDGQRLFLVAERGGGIGGLDLYVANKTKKGWSRLENLGGKVNTAAHEGFPFAAMGGKLYFCSKGHPGYGGYDIFVTEQDSTTGEWLMPKNVGTPFNSPYDDISICFDLTNKQGAFTSTRGGRGDDLFLFSINPELAQKQAELLTAEILLKPSQSIVSEPKKEPKAEIKVEETAIIKPETEEKKQAQTAEETETPAVSEIKEEKKREIKIVEAPQMPQPIEEKKDVKIVEIAKETTPKTLEGYSIAVDPKPQRDSSVSEPKKHYLQQIQAMIDGTDVSENRIFVIENINYTDITATNITSDLALALDRIAEFLTRNRKLTIEIAEHTETKDLDDARAKQISTARAENIVKYLVSQGVNAKRISAQGFGRSRPLKDCRNGDCTPDEDEKNRRIDVRINGIL